MSCKKNRGQQILVSAVVALVIAAGSTALADAAGPAVRPVDRHCVVDVVSISGGVMETGPEVCFPSEADADAFAAFSGRSSRSVSNIIGRHYTSLGYSGSSITIVGTTCGGGVWYPTGYWGNNLESSRHYCGGVPTTFYDSANCSTGAYPIFYQSSSLGWMNNRASCVRYG